MPWPDLLRESTPDASLKKQERIVRALERIADALEQLLPSPFADPARNVSANDYKPATSFSVYGEREAYRDEQEQKRREADEDLERLLTEYE